MVKVKNLLGGALLMLPIMIFHSCILFYLSRSSEAVGILKGVFNYALAGYLLFIVIAIFLSCVALALLGVRNITGYKLKAQFTKEE